MEINVAVHVPGMSPEGEWLPHSQGTLSHWLPRDPGCGHPGRLLPLLRALAKILESHCSLAVEGRHPPRGKRNWTVMNVIIWASSSLWVDLKCCMSLHISFLHMLPYTLKFCRVLLRGMEVSCHSVNTCIERLLNTGQILFQTWVKTVCRWSPFYILVGTHLGPLSVFYLPTAHVAAVSVFSWRSLCPPCGFPLVDEITSRLQFNCPVSL